MELVEDHVAVGDAELVITRPRSSEGLLDERAFEQEEYLPYWAELWPSALALARAVGGRALRGARTLELGCGLGLPSIAAALAGGRVLATDWSPDAVEFTRRNAERNGATVEARVCSWAEPDALVARAPWDLVIGSDLLYEGRNADLLLPLLPRLVDERGEILLADPGRPAGTRFFSRAGERFEASARADAGRPNVTLHRLRLGAAAVRDLRA